MLIIEKISSGYHDKPILHEVSFEVAQGSLVALIGPNGSGKTTLIRTLSGILQPNSGRVVYKGQDLTRLSVQERSKLIAVVPQNRSLPPAFSVYEVVALGRTPHLNWFGQTSGRDHEIIHNAMAQTNLMELAERNITELSGGEQQRVLLARALAQECPILLMDEPTSHLDLQYQVNIMKSAHHLAHPSEQELAAGFEKRCVLVTIHDLNLLARYADQVVLMVGGKIAAVGTPAEVLQPERLSEAYHLPLTNLVDPSTGRFAVIPE